METILQDMDQCGLFQVCHVVLVQLCRFAYAMTQSVMVFGLYNPGWKCLDENVTRSSLRENRSFSHESTVATFTEWMNSSLFHNQFAMNESLTPSHALNETQVANDSFKTDPNSYKGRCGVINSCDTIEFNPSSSTIVSEYGLVCDNIWMAYLIISILNCGMLMGSFIGGQIAERFGRKTNLYGSILTVASFSALAVFSPTWQVYAALAFFSGLGLGGASSSILVLCMEFLNSKWRVRVSAIPVLNMGSFSLAISIYILRDWKHIHITNAVICGVAFLGVFWTPESLRWLVVHKKRSRVNQVVNKINMLNKGTLTTEALEMLMATDDSDTKEKQCTFLDLFRTSTVRLLTMKLGYVWAVSVSVYETISFGIQALPGDFYTNIIFSSIIEIPGPLLIGPLANRVGRRKTGILFTSLGVLCCLSIVLFSLAMEKDSTRDIVITSMAFLNRLFVQSVVCLMIPYSAELMPTVVRNLAFAFFNIAIRVTGLVSPYIIPRDSQSLVVCFAVIMVLQALSTAIFWSLEETKNAPLKDVMSHMKRPERETKM